jgi:sigma-B regulation protein RsbU (phosphoserine phosphatase)
MRSQEPWAMTPRKRFLLKNRMLMANVTANLIAAVVITNVVSPLELSTVTKSQFAIVQMISTPMLFLLGILCFLHYERPMRQYLDRCFTTAEATRARPPQVLRRLLNEPFFAVALDLSIWLLAAVFWSTYFGQKGEAAHVIRRTFLINLNIGLITSVIAFFLLEHIFQKTMAPFFFPQGRIYEVPGTIRISIRLRLAAMLFACNLVPFLASIQVYFNLSSLDERPGVILKLLGDTLVTNSILFMVTGIWIWVLVSTNLSRPFAAIIQTLNRIRQGRFDNWVRVTSNDEIGYTGDVINEMTAGLRERERLRLSLLLAQEVQQRLLPAAPPRIAGLDIAGTSCYCDETGGDYFDYIRLTSQGGDSLGVVVGDVAGHGLSAALLMASARGFFRQRAVLGGSLPQVVADVNCQLCHDVRDSGQFMTAFFLQVDPQTRGIAWVRAGHDPALLYDPVQDGFIDLDGPGLPLGVDANTTFTALARSALADGSILLLGTDGIWETFDPTGAMFGKPRLQSLVRQSRHASAQELVSRIMDALGAFRGPQAASDDTTLVVVKFDQRITGESAPGEACSLPQRPARDASQD